MPNFDGGHYFLTTLAPIRIGAPIDLPEEKRKLYEGNPRAGFLQRVQAALSDMPTALQSPATEQIGVPSPFAKSMRTHFCRFVVIEDTVFNGRTPDNALLTSIGRRDQPMQTKPVDRLPCPYLMCCVDLDAVKVPGEPLPAMLTADEQDAVRDHYLEALWTEGAAELLKVYENCQEFDSETIRTPKDFANYIRACQFETWMSYNDYYLDDEPLPKLATRRIALSLVGPGVLALLGLAAFLIGLIGWLVGFGSAFGMPNGRFAMVALLATLAAVLLMAVAGYRAYGHVVDHGLKAWPPAQYGDLPTVLKGLYLQQRFADFIVANQGKRSEELYAEFGNFLDQHKPDDLLNPATTQAPGVVRA